jgi:hypothetical protein
LADALVDLLPNDLALETVLFAFVKLWENDQRRHERAKYEEYVREHLEEHGYPNFKGNTLPGEVHKASAANIHAVVFQDELDRLVDHLREWGVTRG